MTPKNQVDKLEKQIARKQELLELAKKLSVYHPIFAHERTIYFEHKSYIKGYQDVSVSVADDHAAKLLLDALDIRPAGIFDYEGGFWNATFAPLDHEGVRDRDKLRELPKARFLLRMEGFYMLGRVCLPKITVYVHVGKHKIALTINIQASKFWFDYRKSARKTAGNFSVERYCESVEDWYNACK